MKIKSFKIGIIFADPYNGNLGVAALAYSILYILEKVSQKGGVKFKYFFIDSFNKKNDILRIGDQDVRIANCSYSMSTIKLRFWLKTLITDPLTIINLAQFKVVVDIGEGDSFSDIYGIKRFQRINNAKRHLLFLRKKLILLPQTIGPFSNTEVEQEAIKNIKKAHLVMTRDRQSYDFVKRLLPDKKLHELMDMGFYLPYVKYSQSSNKIRVGINVSGLLWSGGYTKNNQFQLKSDYQDIIHDIIKLFLSFEGIEISLVAHVLAFHERDYDHIENDYKICNELHEIYPMTNVAPAFKTPVEAKSYISSLDFFIGSRMHSCIAAFSSGIPVFPLAYSRKFNGLFGETLRYEFYGDLVNSNSEYILEQLKSAFYKREMLKEKIAHALQTIVYPLETELINLLSETILTKENN